MICLGRKFSSHSNIFILGLGRRILLLLESYIKEKFIYNHFKFGFMSIIDAQIDDEKIRQFASQLEHLGETAVDTLRTDFTGEHSKEFYEGLLSGYATAYATMLTIGSERAAKYIGPVIAFLAREIQKRQTEE